MPQTQFLILFMVFAAGFLPVQAQVSTAQLEAWVENGVVLHDQGDYEGAIRSYDKVLAEDPMHFAAGAEKTMSLVAMEAYEEGIALGEGLIRNHPEEPALSMVFVQMGNALDLAGQAEEAADLYRRGIARFPGSNLLHYNLGITWLRMGKLEAGEKELLHAVSLNPVHPGTHFTLGVALVQQNRRTEGVLALMRFLLLETGTARAIQATALLTQLLEPWGTPESMAEQGLQGYAWADSLLRSDLLAMEERSFRKSVGLLRATEVEQDVFVVQNLLNALAKKREAGGVADVFSSLYLPFYESLLASDLVPAVVYLAHNNTGSRSVGEWINAHFDQVQGLVDLIFSEN